MSDFEETKEKIKKWLIISLVCGIIGSIVLAIISQGRIEGFGWGFLIGFALPTIILLIYGEVVAP